MEQKNIIVAIDGYSACGKSTVAKALAQKANFLYVDSGAMYRAVTLHFLENGVELENQAHVLSSLDQVHIDLEFQNGKTIVLLNNKNISCRIREMDVSHHVPFVSAIRKVRDKLTFLQREMGKNKSIIMDGRDIGSVVFPHAHVKIFMTADPKIRAERRLKELGTEFPEITLEEVLENLTHRDHEDMNREVSPLIQPSDAVVLDNSRLDKEQQLAFIMNVLNQKKIIF